MRIQNKYLRNRLAKHKARKRAIKLEGEFSYKCCFPWSTYGFYHTIEEQKDYHQKSIDNWVKTFLGSTGTGYRNAPKWYKKFIEHKERRKVKKAIDKMCQDVENIEDYEVPNFIHEANWDWF